MKKRFCLALVRTLIFTSVIASCRADVVAWGDSLTYGTGADHPQEGQKTWPGWFTEFSGIKVINKGVGGQSSQQIRDRMFAEPALHEKFTVIWAGRNNYPGPEGVKKHIAEMVAALKHDNYLVVGITNNNAEPKGSARLKIMDTLNADLKAIYGVRFVDVRPLLVAAYDKTIPQDLLDHGNDVVPSSLRSDGLHLNTPGYKIVAQAIYDAYRNVTPKPQGSSLSGVVMTPPESKPIPVGVGKVYPAPSPLPSEFAKPPVEFRLWENGGAPGNPEELHKGQLASKKGAAIMNWGIPSIVVWEPLKAGTNRKAIMLCPGGAYQNICTDWHPQVDGLLQDGFVVFMLKYRTVPGWKECETYALLDAKRGIRFIRTYAAHYGVDPNFIGVAGSSAGSNLVLNLVTHPDAGNPKDEDILERPGTQVAFAVMLSPWFPSNRRLSYYPISKDTPPAFIATAKDDTGAPTSWAESISDAYKKAGVPQFLFQIEKGNHGAFDTSKPDAEVSHWRTLFMEWLGKTFPETAKRSKQ